MPTPLTAQKLNPKAPEPAPTKATGPEPSAGDQTMAFYDALTDAAFDGEPARLKKLIAQADPALFKKATQPESVKALYRRRTPLMLATMGAHAACVKQLAPLSNASDRDCDGETALTLLAEYQSWNNEKAVIESLRALLKHSSVADVNSVAKSATRESTALSNAIARGRVSVAGLLLAAGADATLRKASGETPLMQAASRGLPQLVKMLLPLSDPQAKDHEGGTALSMAIRSHRPGAREKACVKLLLEKGRPEEPLSLFAPNAAPLRSKRFREMTLNTAGTNCTKTHLGAPRTNPRHPNAARRQQNQRGAI